MIRDITIGQYYPANSIIHKIDPRIKIIVTILYIVSLFIVRSFIGYGFVFAVLASLIILSKVPVKFMLKGLKSIMVIIIFTVIINVFTTKGEIILAEIGRFTITLEGVLTAAKMCIRLVMIIVGSSILTLTTTPLELTDGIEYLLKPLKRVGVPSHEIAMMITIALRFIPTILDETDKIMKAQQARGADFDTGGLIKKAKSLIPVLVPLFVSAFRRAEELAVAMEARCYRGDENRTKMKQMKFKGMDYITCGLVIIYMLIIFVLRTVLGL